MLDMLNNLKWNLTFHHIVLIILLLALLFYNLVTMSFFIVKEGAETLTKQEIRDAAAAKSKSMVEANKPQPEVKNLQLLVELQDTATYQECVKNPAPPPAPPQAQTFYGRGGEPATLPPNYDDGYRAFLPFKSTFIQLNPSMSYYISGTSEGAPSQDATVKTFPITNKNPVNEGDCTSLKRDSAIPNTKPIPATSPSTVTIPVETGKFNGYIVVAPSSSSLFPPNFTLTLTNNNSLQIALYGQYAEGLTNVSPVPNNMPVKPETISKKTGFPSGVYDASDNVIKIAGVNLGMEPLVIANIGGITNSRNRTIGQVTTNNNIITINCTDSTDITGIIIYLGRPYTA
jgi:hypothetical protein